MIQYLAGFKNLDVKFYAKECDTGARDPML